jgi:iron(III) transport system ATP-binding protein
VALARALVKRPKLLLLDEPLSNLDAKLREETRLEIKDLVDELGITVLYVTHDQAEALSMSDRILVMGDGSVLQEGTPLEIYQNPQSEFVASFIGSANLIQGKLTDRTEDSGNIETSSGRLTCRLSSGLQAGDTVLVSMRPEEVRVFEEKPRAGNVLPGTVSKLTFFGDWLECRTQVDSASIRAKLHPDAAFQKGQRVFLEIAKDKCLAIPFAAKSIVNSD